MRVCVCKRCLTRNAALLTDTRRRNISSPQTFTQSQNISWHTLAHTMSGDMVVDLLGALACNSHAREHLDTHTTIHCGRRQNTEPMRGKASSFPCDVRKCDILPRRETKQTLAQRETQKKNELETVRRDSLCVVFFLLLSLSVLLYSDFFDSHTHSECVCVSISCGRSLCVGPHGTDLRTYHKYHLAGAQALPQTHAHTSVTEIGIWGEEGWRWVC